MKYLNTLKGNCHCGQIRFELRTNRDETNLVPRTCQCPFCKKHGASWISDPEGEAHVQYDDEKNVSFYSFGTKTAASLVCRECGVPTVAVCDIGDHKRSVLNATAMLAHTFPSEPILTNFDAETVESRLARREKTWTGNTFLPN